MFILKLHIESLFQSWGLSVISDQRPTSLFPTKSGIIGLCMNSLGKNRDDTDFIQYLNDSLLVHVGIINPGKVVEDYQTSGGGNFYKENTYRFDTENKEFKEFIYKIPKYSGSNLGNIVMSKYYLQNAKFDVFLEGEINLLKELHQSVMFPQRALYFGRKCCIPSSPIVQDDSILDKNIDEIVKNSEEKYEMFAVERRETTEDTGVLFSDVAFSYDRMYRNYGFRNIQYIKGK